MIDPLPTQAHAQKAIDGVNREFARERSRQLCEQVNDIPYPSGALLDEAVTVTEWAHRIGAIGKLIRDIRISQITRKR